ncbi:MAG: undecaprenyldiphospho-muramoylpentapeptide beta-N-acetylglucosaminyltransferase [Treponema sp.]|nr:undecaprenyldiphospho-muramoylpentapeptide beta-N-acetylglucosaminyltransferase [Treponema sp.]
MTDKKITLAFTGGGTGGHIYPGLAIASCLQKLMPCVIFWIGSNKGMDRSIAEAAGVKFYGIPSGKLRRNFSLKNITDIFNVARGFFAARRILIKEKPALLFSKGSFASVPPSAAAHSLKIPVFCHESDFTPALATRINSGFSEKIFIPYSESMKLYPAKVQGKLEVSGNPVRKEFTDADSSRGREFLKISEGERVLLVLGGSTGSLEINRLIRESLPELTRFYTVVHQCGSNEALPEPGPGYKPYAYINEELPHVIAAAELVICRGGAGTLWECAFLKKPMIIIPLRGSGTRGDQVENAVLFEKAGAAINFSDNINAPKLAALVAALAADKNRRDTMAASGIGSRGAAEYIAEKIIQKVSGL